MSAASRWRSHAGAISGEAIAVIVVAAVIAAVWSIGIEDEVEEAGAAAVCSLFDPGCADDTGAQVQAQAQGGPQAQASSDEDRTGGARDREDRDRGRELDRREPGRDGRRGAGDTDPPPAGEGTPGPDPATAAALPRQQR